MTIQTVTAYFEGVPCMADFTLSQGILPGSGTLSFAEQWAIPKYGALRISDGITSIVMNKVYAVNPRIEQDPHAGERWVVTIYDKRFVWKWGHIHGIYNMEDLSGAPIQDKTLTELLRMCLDTLGEVGYTLHNIPLYAPKVAWEAENPAKALNDLCEQFGLVIGMDATPPNRIVISPYDEIREFPNTPSSHNVEMITGDIIPSRINLIGDRKRLQFIFENLIPVGIDTDGYIKHIDDLSYKPAGSDNYPDEIWGMEIMRMFSNLATEEAKILAEQCIFKWYAVDWETLIVRKPAMTPEAVLPFLTKISAVITVSGKDEHDKSYIIGNSAVLGDIEWYHTGSVRMSKEFELDKDFGIVKFKDPVYKVHSTGFDVDALVRADIDLVACFESKYGDIKDFPVWHYVNQGSIEPEAIHHDKGIKAYYIDGVLQYTEELGIYAEAKLYQLVKFHQEQRPIVREYPAIFQIDVRGIFKAVRWVVDLSGATTEIQKQIEVPKPNMPTFEEKLNTRKLKYLFGTPK